MRWPVADVIVATGVVLVQLVTANLLVRLVIDSAGVPEREETQRVQGGWLLGILERIIIVGLGAIGQFVAAAIVLATKALLHLPALGLQQPRGQQSADTLERFVLAASPAG